jgi:hypothetical protein
MATSKTTINTLASAAAQDLGLGSELKDQVDENNKQLKKKKKLIDQTQNSDNPFSVGAVGMLLGGKVQA